MRKLQKRIVFGGSSPEDASHSRRFGTTTGANSASKPISAVGFAVGVSAYRGSLLLSVHLAAQRLVTLTIVSQQSCSFCCAIAAADMLASAQGRVAKAACAESITPTTMALTRKTTLRDSFIGAGL